MAITENFKHGNPYLWDAEIQRSRTYFKKNRVINKKSPALNLDSGCCSMNISFPAHGLNDLGCCAYSEFGCCPDDLGVASGPYGKMTFF